MHTCSTRHTVLATKETEDHVQQESLCVCDAGIVITCSDWRADITF